MVGPQDRVFAGTGLKRASVFRLAKLLTIERTLILRRLGNVDSELQAKLDECLKKALALYKK